MTTRLARVAERLASRPGRTEFDPALIWAAVAVILAPDPDALLLIRRAERAGDPWSGHMALPGGRWEPGDPSLLETAIRETAEEVGVKLELSQLLGTLDDVAPRTPVLPPVAVRPYVFALPGRPVVTPNREVAAVQWTDLDHLVHPERYRPVELVIRGQTRQVDAYHLTDAIVWGMTERILTTLLGHLK